MQKGTVKKTKYCIIFDLDGTLYSFKGGRFQGSKLQKRVLANARRYISNQLRVPPEKAKVILADILKSYGEEISIGLEKEYGFDRYDYFETVWNIPARGFVEYPKGLRSLLLRIKNKYDVFLLSDAPKVWIANVLRALGVEDIFTGRIFSGEGDNRKGFGNVFQSLPAKLGCLPKECVVVGDQEDTDIIPAKQAGLRTVFVGQNRISTQADVSVKNLNQLEDAITLLHCSRIK